MSGGGGGGGGGRAVQLMSYGLADVLIGDNGFNEERHEARRLCCAGDCTDMRR